MDCVHAVVVVDVEEPALPQVVPQRRQVRVAPSDVAVPGHVEVGNAPEIVVLERHRPSRPGQPGARSARRWRRADWAGWRGWRTSRRRRRNAGGRSVIARRRPRRPLGRGGAYDSAIASSGAARRVTATPSPVGRRRCGRAHVSLSGAGRPRAGSVPSARSSLARSIASSVRSGDAAGGSGAFDHDGQLPAGREFRIIIRQLGQGPGPELLMQLGQLPGDHGLPRGPGDLHQVGEERRQPRGRLEQDDAPLLRRRTLEQPGTLGPLPAAEIPERDTDRRAARPPRARSRRPTAPE